MDGKFLVDTPQNLVRKGQVARVPMISGDCDDEGTFFAVPNLNDTSVVSSICSLHLFIQQLRRTTADFNTYFKTIIAPIGPSQTKLLDILYPQDATKGSPFNTGTANNISLQYKRFGMLL